MFFGKYDSVSMSLLFACVCFKPNVGWTYTSAVCIILFILKKKNRPTDPPHFCHERANKQFFFWPYHNFVIGRWIVWSRMTIILQLTNYRHSMEVEKLTKYYSRSNVPPIQEPWPGTLATSTVEICLSLPPLTKNLHERSLGKAV